MTLQELSDDLIIFLFSRSPMTLCRSKFDRRIVHEKEGYRYPDFI